MSNYKPFMALFVLLIALLVACGPMPVEPGAGQPAATATPEVTQPPTELPATETPAAESAASAITAAAIAHLAGELGVAEAEIEVVSAEETEFTDSCLGLGQAHESCLQAITPGWLVMLSAQGQVYEARTDETGQQVRLAPETETESAADPNAATAAAIAHLANELGVAEAEIEVVSLEAAEYSDSCLGLGQPHESCLQAITPGWLVMLSAEGQVYEAHTDEAGQQVRLAAEPVAPGIEEGVVVYQVSGGIAGIMEQYVISANGSVEKMVGSSEGDGPVQAFAVDPERVSRLLSMLGEAGIFELEGDYMPKSPILDGFQHVITITLGDKTTMFRTMDAADETELPPAVTESVALLQEFVAELDD
jgi:hypothetical protein